MGEADMHIHTTASDGVSSPARIVELAVEAGLQAVAVTDHDTIGGVREAAEAGLRHGITVVPGVEISTRMAGRDIHMLGYYIDIEDRQLLKRLDYLRSARERRNQQIIEKLHACGIDITITEVWNTVHKEPGKDLTIGRPHIAEVLVRKGAVRTISEAFDRYLGEGAVAYVSPKRITPQDAVQWIREAGGSAVIAHPGLYGDDELVEEIIRSGVDGIEAYHSDHTPEQEKRYAQLAERYGILATAGSDYHGERMGEMCHSHIGSRKMDIRLLSELRRRDA